MKRLALLWVLLVGAWALAGPQDITEPGLNRAASSDVSANCVEASQPGP
jgi:hypothetical protein